VVNIIFNANVKTPIKDVCVAGKAHLQKSNIFSRRCVELPESPTLPESTGIPSKYDIKLLIS